MSKKVTSLAVALTLLLATAQLALAQQNTDHTQSVNSTFDATGGTQTTGENQTAGGGQTTAPDPPPQAPSQEQPAGEAQPSQPSSNPFVRLNADNQLVVDCEAISEEFAKLQQASNTQTADPQTQSELALAEELVRLCEAGGFTPSSSGGSEPTGSDTTGSTQT